MVKNIKNLKKVKTQALKKKKFGKRKIKRKNKTKQEKRIFNHRNFLQVHRCTLLTGQG